MKNDLITIFNQLTSSELADYNLFSNIIENHYEKFKYLYSLIEDIDLSTIDKIYCSDDKYTLKTTIDARKNKYLNDIVYSINSNRYSYIHSDYFDMDIVQKHNQLIINIKMKSDLKEDDIYANRFV